MQISSAEIQPNATTSVTTGVNLFSKSIPPAADWTGGATPPTNSYNNVSASTIYDSLGNAHTLSMYFIAANPQAAAGSPNAATPPGTLNQWYVAFQIDGQTVPPINPSPSDNTNNLFTANFNTDGTFAGVASPGGTAITNNLIPISTNLQNGANPLSFNVDLSTSTQFGSPYLILQSISNDGYTTGSLNGLEIDRSGFIIGSYSNGRTLTMGQIQLANFPDPQGLQNVGNTSWAASVASGQPLVNVPGAGGIGNVLSGNLEDSNVDLTSELVNLITAQRNFQRCPDNSYR